MILVDTSVWVQSFRSSRSPEAEEMRRLLERNEVAITGVIIGELLQGARDEHNFQALRSTLGALAYLETSRDTWVNAGRLAFNLRQQGKGIPFTDTLIATVALEKQAMVFSLDEHFERVPGLTLHAVG